MKTNKMPMMVLTSPVFIALGWFLYGAVGGGDGNDKVKESTLPRKAMTSITHLGDLPDDGPLKRKSPNRLTPTEKTVGITESDAKERENYYIQRAKDDIAERRAGFQRRINELAASLPLDEIQKAVLQAWLDERIAAAESACQVGNWIWNRDSGFQDDLNYIELNERMSSLSEEAFEEKLASTLGQEQKVALAELKKRKALAKADAIVLGRLAGMQGVIDFEEGQRDEVYRILSQSAIASLQRAETRKGSSTVTVGAQVIGMDPYDIGLEGVRDEAYAALRDSGEPADQKPFEEKIHSLIEQRIEAKLDQFRPVLNDIQLEAFRAELKKIAIGNDDIFSVLSRKAYTRIEFGGTE